MSHSICDAFNQRSVATSTALWESIDLRDSEPFRRGMANGTTRRAPEHIHNVFAELISGFHKNDCKNFQSISVEEQLAILLYICVAGLSTRHGEIFKQLKGAISK